MELGGRRLTEGGDSEMQLCGALSEMDTIRDGQMFFLPPQDK